MAQTNWENMPSTATPINAQNLNKIENMQKYLTTETLCGTYKTKPLYRKVIPFTSTLPNGDTNIAHNVSNIGTVVKAHLIGDEAYVFPYMDSSGKMTLIDQVTSTNVVIRNFTGSAWYSTAHSFNIVLEYTKTTD